MAGKVHPPVVCTGGSLDESSYTGEKKQNKINTRFLAPIFCLFHSYRVNKPAQNFMCEAPLVLLSIIGAVTD